MKRIGEKLLYINYLKSQDIKTPLFSGEYYVRNVPLFPLAISTVKHRQIRNSSLGISPVLF